MASCFRVILEICRFHSICAYIRIIYKTQNNIFSLKPTYYKAQNIFEVKRLTSKTLFCHVKNVGINYLSGDILKLLNQLNNF